MPDTAKKDYIMNKTALRIGQHTIHQRAAVSGDQPAIIFIHGLGVSGDYYLPLARELATMHDVYVLDLPGYGTTPKPTKALTIIQLSKVVEKFITQSKLKNVVIVGQSMGCQIVTHAAVASPELFRNIILLAPTVNRKERYLFMQTLRLLQDCLHEPPHAVLLVIRDYLRMGLRRYLATSHDMVQDNILTTIANCRTDTLIIRGNNDPIVPHDWVKKLSRVHPRASLTELPNAPHLLHLKYPKEVAQLCRQFIEK